MTHFVEEVETWKQELQQAGWTEIRTDIWQAPSGLKYNGTFQAWKLMKAHPELQVKPR